MTTITDDDKYLLHTFTKDVQAMIDLINTELTNMSFKTLNCNLPYIEHLASCIALRAEVTVDFIVAISNRKLKDKEIDKTMDEYEKAKSKGILL